VRDGKVGVVINQTGKATGMTPSQFAKGISVPVLATLDEERKAVSAAVAGKPIVQDAKRGKFSVALRKIVEPMAPREKKEKRGGLFGRSRKGDEK
jgi:Flp pilus assembly CpaE family ATPase